MFIDEDAASAKKHFARIGERYFDGDHDIKNYRMFYFNSDGQLVEDTSRANVRIPHPFFKELTEQGTQYTLSGSDGFVFSNVPELQSELDARFNNNDDFIDELSETLTDCQTKGFAYMYAMKDSTDKLKFTCADSIGVVEVEARFAEDGKDHVIYWYVDRVDKEGHRIKKIMDWDDEQVVYYVQTDEGEIQLDDKAKVNPRPHILYQVDGDDNTYIDSLGFLPFFRLDNNKKQFSNLKAVKDLIDDYDLMASSLSNNLIDFDHPLYAVKGFEGDNLDELQQNLKTKKIVGVGSDGGIEVHTVDVPYEARKVKLELDEKNIYRFGMGLNLSGLKDTSATTNIAIKAAYSLLDLRCKHLERNIKRFLRKIVAVCIDEINQQNGTDYQITDVYFEFTHEVMSNEQENEQNELTEAQKQQVQINTLLSLAQIFGDDLTIQYICDVLDIDYEDVKDKLPDNEADKVQQVQDDLDSIIPDAAATGSTASLGNGTGRAEKTTTYEGGVAKEYTVDGKTSVCWRGKENFWGNIWKFVYGINIWGNGKMGGGQPYICSDFSFAESKNSGNYEPAGFTVTNANGYISAMGYSTACDWLFIASECLGNSSLPVGDYTYITVNLNGYRIALLGSGWNDGGSAGGFYWTLNYGVGSRGRNIGGRLVYIPTRNSATYTAAIEAWKQKMAA